MPRDSVNTAADFVVPSPRRVPGATAPAPRPGSGGDSGLVVVVSPDPQLQAEVVRRLAGLVAVLAVSDAAHAIAQLRQDEPAVTGPLPAELLVDSREHRVVYRGVPLPLTQHEHVLFTLMASDPGRAWTHDQLHREVWGSPHLPSASDLQSTVKRLRRKLDEAAIPLIIESVRGVGFRLVETATPHEEGPAGTD
ncbi:MAG: winged helix-turn-helix domain-containing protein [Nocardioides sp.]